MFRKSFVLFAAFFVLTSTWLQQAQGATSPHAACIEKGFAPGIVACSTCTELGRAVGSGDALVESCNECCSTTVDLLLPRRYESAVLQVNRMMGGASGGVNEWLEKSAEKWSSRVQVVDAFVSSPTLVLLSEDQEGDASPPSPAGGKKGAGGKRAKASGTSGPTAESVVVGSWKIEQIDAFLSAKLRVES